MRLAVVQGEYIWHQHDHEDEFFYVVEGRLFMDLEEDRTVELAERQGFTVPRGVRHRPRASQRTVILMVDGAGIVPTGDRRAPEPRCRPSTLCLGLRQAAKLALVGPHTSPALCA